MKKNLLRILVPALVAVVAILALGVSAFADAPGVVNVNVAGSNGAVSIQTVAPYVQDALALSTTGTFNVNQSNRFVESAAWAGDGNDIDRTAGFDGAGSVATTTNYLSTDAWALAAANMDISVTATGADATGSIHQNLTFDQNHGGAFTQDQWKKQRDTDVYAGGNYALDVSNIGASIDPSLGSMPTGSLPAYSLDIAATAASGNVGLHFDPAIGGNQALSNNGDHGTNTGVGFNFIMAYTGAPVIGVTGQTVTGGSFSIIENFLTGTVAGTGLIK